MNRTQKIEALKEVFKMGNKSILEGVDKMVVHTIVVEKNGLYQIVPIEPTFTIPDHELTLKEFEEWTSGIPLFPDIN